jgi:hypothetical protein
MARSMLLVTFVLLPLQFDYADTGVYKIYMRRTGSDSNPGTPASPKRTLAGVHSKIVADAPDEDIEVHVDPDGGEFTAQTVTWTYVLPDHTITFLPWGWDQDSGHPPARRPVFDGNTTDPVEGAARLSTWFDLHLDRRTSGSYSNVRFYYLHVKNYVRMAIRLAGNGDTASGWQGNNAVRNCIFQDIGNGGSCTRSGCCRNGASHPSAVCPNQGLGAIVLQNSRDNWFEQNIFIDLVNADKEAGHVHGIYFDGGSDNNVVAWSRFENITGDPIRVRAQCNDNSLHHNCYVNAGQNGFYSDYFQNQDAACSLSGSHQECPSWRNTLSFSVLACGYRDRALPYDYHYRGKTCMPSRCVDYSPDVRFSASGNRNECPWTGSADPCDDVSGSGRIPDMP